MKFRRSGISAIVGSVFFLLVVFLVFTTMVLIFSNFDTYVSKSNASNQQQQQDRGTALSITGVTFGGVLVPPVATTLTGQQNIQQKALLPVSNMNFSTNMKGWFLSRSYALLKDNATVVNSLQNLNATNPVALPGSVDFLLNVTNTDTSGAGRAIAYVSIAADQNFSLLAAPLQKPPPAGWNTPIVIANTNTITWTAQSGIDITPQSWQTFTWSASVPYINATFFHTVTFKWVSSPPDQVPYVDSGIGTVNTTIAAENSGGTSKAVLTPAPANTVPGGAASGHDATATKTSSQSGPGSLYGTFTPTFGGQPIPAGQQLIMTLNYTTSFTLDTATANSIISSSCCVLTWAYSLDELVSIRNPSLEASVSLTRETPFTPQVFDVVVPTLVNSFRASGWQYRHITFNPNGFWGPGRYDLTVSVTADIPGAASGSSGYPATLGMHFDDVGVALKLGPSTYYVDNTILITTNVKPYVVQGIDIGVKVTGPSSENFSSYIYLEDVTQSQVIPFWVELAQLSFTPPASTTAHVPIQTAGLYVAPNGNIQARIYAVATGPFTVKAAISMILKTINQTAVVATVFNNSTFAAHLVGLYLSGPTGTSHFDNNFAPPNNFSLWVNPGESISIQEPYTWAPGQVYVATLVSDHGVVYSRAYNA